MSNKDRQYIDGSFELEFVISGEDEHGLPLLEVNMYPVLVAGMTGTKVVFRVDNAHLVAGFTIPLEDTGLKTSDLESLPLHGGWATIATAHAEGFHPEELEGAFGARAATIILEALADALLSESINSDLHGLSYRSSDLSCDNRYEEVLAMHRNLTRRIEAEEQKRVTNEVFNALMAREFGP